MFDDEDEYPDYFLDDDEEEKKAPTPTPARPSASGRHISFDPVPAAPAVRNDDDDDDEPEDYFLASDDDDDNEAAPARRGGCLPRWFKGLALLTLIVLAVVGYFRYLTPVVDDATMTVNVVNVERRGLFFKTYEAEIVDPARLADTAGVYTRPRSVSIANAEVAARLRQACQSGQPVTIRYEIYSATLPWRGASKFLVVGSTP